jgi:hypothetical protein
VVLTQTIFPMLQVPRAVATEPVLATILLPEEDEIRLALEAGPGPLRSGATVYVFGPSGYRKVREGTNGFTCLVNRDGNQNGDHDLKPTCWDGEGTRTLVPVMLRVGELIAKMASAEEIKRDIDAGFSDGRFSSPRRAGIAYMLEGDLQFDPQTSSIVKTLFAGHYMIYAPGVTNEDIGAESDPYKRNYARPYVYAGYSGRAHTSYIIILASSDGTGHSH